VPARDGRDDWAAQTTDQIVRLVETVRTRTTTPAVKVARLLAFGLLIAMLVHVLIVTIAILLVRVFTYLPGHNVWLAHFIVGAMFCGAGLLCMAMRHSPVA